MNTWPKALKVTAALVALLAVVYLSQALAWLAVPLLKIGVLLSALWVLVDMFS